MRIFNHWTRIEDDLAVDGRLQRVHCDGGSNVSIAVDPTGKPVKVLHLSCVQFYRSFSQA